MQFLTSVFSALLATSLCVQGVPILKRDLSFAYGSTKVRGVNLGGWFVTEPFISPSLYEGVAGNPVDEYHLCQYLGQEQAQTLLQDHWATWITEDDFAQIADWGFNHVRIPIGYWAFQLLDNDPYVQGQVEYLDKAITWARNNNLHVWIDLHGAPGSQNGFDNSGLRDSLMWQQGNNTGITQEILIQIANKYGASDYNDVVSAIELLNEPLGPSLNMDEIKQFTIDGWNIVRDSGSDIGVTFHDAFQPIGYWNNFLQPPEYWNVILDHHQYQVFSPGELERDIDDHVKVACDIGYGYQQETLWDVTGEWSGALTDCTPWLNGVGRGARYDGQYAGSPYIGSCNNINNITMWSAEKKQDTRRFIEAQMDAYEQGAGWIFWTYKTETTVEWDVRVLIYSGLFPYPLDERFYPNQCGYY